MELATQATRMGISTLEGGDFQRSIEHDRIFGVDPKSKFDLNDLFEAIYPGDRKLVQDELKTVLAGKKSEFNLEHRIVRREGVIRWIHAFGKTILEPKSDRRRLIVGVIDITDRKKIEADREMFIASLSHDLRNPLSAIRAHAELLERYPLGPKENQASLGRIISNVERADRMIQDMLNLARVRAGEKWSLVYTDCDLKCIVSDSLREFAARYGDRFELISEGDFRWNWPCQDIRRIIDNLVENAIKYGSADRPIQVTLSRPAKSDGLVLSVKNEGNPIGFEDQETILRPLGRPRQIQEGGKVKGWGLGLAYVRSFVEAIGGNLSLESSDTKGTVFKVVIPISSKTPQASIVLTANRVSESR